MRPSASLLAGGGGGNATSSLSPTLIDATLDHSQERRAMNLRNLRSFIELLREHAHGTTWTVNAWGKIEPNPITFLCRACRGTEWPAALYDLAAEDLGLKPDEADAIDDAAADCPSGAWCWEMNYYPPTLRAHLLAAVGLRRTAHDPQLCCYLCLPGGDE